MAFVVGQVAGWGLADVMQELLREQDLALARKAVARMEEKLTDERTRTHEVLQRQYTRLAAVELRAARVRHGARVSRSGERREEPPWLTRSLLPRGSPRLSRRGDLRTTGACLRRFGRT